MNWNEKQLESLAYHGFRAFPRSAPRGSDLRTKMKKPCAGFPVTGLVCLTTTWLSYLVLSLLRCSTTDRAGENILPRNLI